MNSLGFSLAVVPHSQSQVKQWLSNAIPQISIFNCTNYKCNNKIPIKSLKSITFQAEIFTGTVPAKLYFGGSAAKELKMNMIRQLHFWKCHRSFLFKHILLIQILTFTIFQGMNLIFVVPSIMLYSSEISPTRCNNCVFILRNGFTLHVSGWSRQHDTEQGSDYQQLHNDRTIYYWHIWQKLTT